MTHTYIISGMTCNNCTGKVKNELLKLGDITEATIQLTAPQATLSMSQHVPLSTLQQALTRAGNYTIMEAGTSKPGSTGTEAGGSWLATYKPILLVFAYITGITLLTGLTGKTFSTDEWMQQFMAAFFLVFSFFKLINLKGFAESYSSYDLIARRWQGWGYVYAFIELGLGIAYLTRFNPLLTNAITFTVMTISIIGVLQAVLSKRKIQCACLGAVFNLPMSTITITEDALMIVMSGSIFLQWPG